MTTRRSNDPIAAGARHAKAQRRVGQDARCACGENRSQALIAGRERSICYECDSRRLGKTTMETHHIAGEANSPITVEVPANDHRAVLSEAQYEWPPSTLRNVDGSPLLRAAAALRSTVNFLELFTRWLTSITELLERLDSWLRKDGSVWWIDSPFEDWRLK